MINLLPPQQKKELFYEERYKLSLISGISIIVFLVSLFSALLAVKFYIYGKTQSNKINIAAISQDQDREIIEINKKLERLDFFYGGSPNITEFLEKIYKIIPENVRLTSISLNFSQKDGNFSVSLRGFSPTRELLIQLKKNLESEATLQDINFPVSNWVKPEDVDFSVNFMVKI